SIAVNGVCFTVTSLSPGDAAFTVRAVPQTWRLTTLRGRAPGPKVNLEPPSPAGDPMSGHRAMGHVDGVAEVVGRAPEGYSVRVTVNPPQGLMRYIVEKGSVALEGVSLTVAAVGPDRCDAVLIPHTCQVTTLGRLAPGARVNIEVD